MQDPLRKYQAFSSDRVSRKKPKKRKPRVGKKLARAKAADEKFPVILFLLCACGLIFSGLILMYPDQAISRISSLRVRIPLLLAADEGKDVSKASKNNGKGTLNMDVGKASADDELNTQMLPSEEIKLTMENTSLNQALEGKRKDLEKKERDLAQLAEDLETKKQEIDKQLSELKSLRRNISSVLDDRVKADQASVDKLVEVYSNMKPTVAAKIITSINEELAIKILGKMKKQNAAEILNFIEPKKAQELSEKYAGLEKK